MMAITINQAVRGQLAGPALPMLWNALTLLDQFTAPALKSILDPDDGE
jgi:hypothetical protein